MPSVPSESRRIDATTRRSLRMDKAAVLYFLVVFGSGIVLGTLRTLLVEPQLGATMAELLELPLMITICLLAARWIVRRVPMATVLEWCTVGALSLCLLLFAECVLVTQIRKLSIAEYFSTRAPIAVVAYGLGLAVYTFAPAGCAAIRNRRSHNTQRLVADSSKVGSDQSTS